MTYVGFAIADSMFPPECVIGRQPVTGAGVRALLHGEFVNCCNASHRATLDALAAAHPNEWEFLKLVGTVPATPPKVALASGDRILVVSVRGLPRLTEDRHYTPEEIAGASFAYGVWTVA